MGRKAPKVPKPKPLPAIARFANFAAEQGSLTTLPNAVIRPNKLTPLLGRNRAMAEKPFLTGDTM